MGAHFRIPIGNLTPGVAEMLVQTCPLRIVADAGADLHYDAPDWRRSATLIVGSEATGVAADVAALATDAVSIPLAAAVESLNAAVAGAVILFEAARQRRRHVPDSHGAGKMRGHADR